MPAEALELVALCSVSTLARAREGGTHAIAASELHSRVLLEKCEIVLVEVAGIWGDAVRSRSRKREHRHEPSSSSFLRFRDPSSPLCFLRFFLLRRLDDSSSSIKPPVEVYGVSEGTCCAEGVSAGSLCLRCDALKRSVASESCPASSVHLHQGKRCISFPYASCSFVVRKRVASWRRARQADTGRTQNPHFARRKVRAHGAEPVLPASYRARARSIPRLSKHASRCRQVSPRVA